MRVKSCQRDWTHIFAARQRPAPQVSALRHGQIVPQAFFDARELSKLRPQVRTRARLFRRRYLYQLRRDHRHRRAGFFHSRYVYEHDHRSTAHDLGALRGDLSIAIFPSLARSLARARSPLQSGADPAQRAAEEIGIQPVGCR